ncbi:putative lipid II flippase MurJ [Candidatus Phycosocius bacilliformis]|jgi:putative peptidoglycan lipid II flippase|uniref:Probable lipid II flippase MurJ n=1 Tax=Candidatus Phycosocius bacilliformis TaxID=1445552 RepID=A0A2P2E7A0_9PROT|nr:murein biosynthesis integral membrane protein MurJ [Candidatus Phycosocius bacilliformis]GBF56924.1 putative lipid II flippase MurJ [Candidatus Phycosocius bacilliformis]
MSLARNTLVQAGFTLVSRLLGYARDRVISNLIGAGWVGDAFATAQAFPNLFRRILAEGAFSQAFVPFYARTQAEIGKERAAEVAGDAFSVLTLVAAGVTLLAQIAMPWIMLVIHGGYADQPQAFQFAILLTQITMPYLVGMAMSSLFAGILNTAGKFALSAAAPTVLNLTILLSVAFVREPHQAAFNAAVAITASGFLQAAALYIGCRRLGVKIGFRKPILTPEVKTIMTVMVPSVIAGSATQINVLVSQSLSSHEVGAKSWLYAADRLFQLPLGLIGVAIGVALLPRLARAAADPKSGDGTKALDEAFVLSMAFTLPAAAALVVIPFFLMQGFWAGGQFTEADARATADALFHYGWGVPAFVMIRILAPPFFARGDTKRPMNYALVGVVVNVCLGAAIFYGLRAIGQPGYVGLAVAASLAGWANALLLAATLLREGTWKPEGWAISKLVRILVATLAMSLVLAYAGLNRVPIEGWFEARLIFGKEVATLLVCFIGAVVYGAAAFALRAVTVADIKLALQKPTGPAPAGTTDDF